MKIKFGIGALLAAMLFLSMAFVPAVSGYIERNSDQDVLLENGISYTDAELQDLYRKYNINENDLKFAKNELPNYLEGTILCSDVRVIASETGEPPEGLKEGEHYDVVITTEEMLTIIDEARNRYIEKYSVNPAKPKIDIVEGYALPEEEVNMLVKSGEIRDSSAQPLVGILAGPSDGPHAINELIVAHIFVAKDSTHKPTEAITGDTHDALYRFETEFDVNMNVFWYWNSWDASDVSPADSTSSALADLKEDESWVIDEENDIVIGWLHDMDNNGRAEGDGFYAVCSDTASGVDWPEDNIVQHETSHLFNAPDHGYIGPYCVMTYTYAGVNSFGDVWCNDCSATVDENIWGN